MEARDEHVVIKHANLIHLLHDSLFPLFKSDRLLKGLVESAFSSSMITQSCNQKVPLSKLCRLLMIRVLVSSLCHDVILIKWAAVLTSMLIHRSRVSRAENKQ